LAEHPFMAKLARWGVNLHMSTLFGLAAVLEQDCVVDPADGAPSASHLVSCVNRATSVGQTGWSAVNRGRQR
jgi:hypothetical protein